jgi:hypothetical protein
VIEGARSQGALETQGPTVDCVFILEVVEDNMQARHDLNVLYSETTSLRLLCENEPNLETISEKQTTAKRAGRLAQMVDCLLSNCKVLSSNFSTAKKKKKRHNAPLEHRKVGN